MRMRESPEDRLGTYRGTFGFHFVDAAKTEMHLATRYVCNAEKLVRSAYFQSRQTLSVVIPAKAGIHFNFDETHGFPLSRE
jgi:hypothetical protein